jgi:UDP-galactopyranose mutase
MIIKSLCDINLHDSELLGIRIDKVNGDADRIILDLNYIEDYETARMCLKELVFTGCMKAMFNLNFGVLTPDSLKGGFEVEESDLVKEVMAVFSRMNVGYQKELRHFQLETIATASRINIVAERVELL